MTDRPEKTKEQIIRQDGRYCTEAVEFISEALSYTSRKSHPQTGPADQRRHVSGDQLCNGLRELAKQRWGFMAKYVLGHWNIKSTRDFGEIVFLMVNNGWMHKEPTDSIDDFDGVYDFDDAFLWDFDLRSGEEAQ